MFAMSSSSANTVVEHSVHSTGVPLSERFKSVPSHNPLRPNFDVKRVVSGFDDDVSAPAINRGPMRRRGQSTAGFGLGAGVNKLAVLRASKDAEILRLRSQLRVMQSELKRLGTNRGGKRIGNFKMTPKSQILDRIGRPTLRRRGGGGVVFGNNGKFINLRSAKSAELLGLENVTKIPRSPLKRTGKGPAKLNFFGTPKSKEALDDELEQYMSRTKSKQKTDLDKELDEYMKVARSQSFAGRVGLTAEAAITLSTAESEDAEMEVVEL